MKYVAFLKGINVGGHTLKMELLRSLLEGLGLARVETFIASGNAIFETSGKVKALESHIEAHLHKELGWPSAAFLRTLPELAAIVERRPFDEIDATVYIGFAKKHLDSQALEPFVSEKAAFAVLGQEFYWLAHETMGSTKITTARLEKALASEVTMRNSTTLQKLLAKHG